MIVAEDFTEQTWHRLTVDDIDDRNGHHLIGSSAVNNEPQESISRFFSQMTDVIAGAVARRQPILIHCAAGMSRSVTIVAAYLCAAKALKPADAVALIKKKRPIAAPNKGFLQQLQQWTLQ